MHPIRVTRAFSRSIRLARVAGICSIVALIASLATQSTATAQGGMGGGGMGGGMGGGRGRGGGMGGGMGGRPQSPADMVKENLERNDPLKFLLDRKKPLALSDAQRDTLKRYQKELEDAQRPVFKELEKISSSMPGRGMGGGGMGGGGMGGGGMGGGGMGGGGMGGGGMGGGGMGGGGRGRGGDMSGDSTGGRGRRGGQPDTVRILADKLTDIQDSFRDRARAHLDATQRVKADSLEQEWLAELRKKDQEQREKRRPGHD